MGDFAEEKGGNSSNEEEILKSEKINDPSIEEFITPKIGAGKEYSHTKNKNKIVKKESMDGAKKITELDNISKKIDFEIKNDSKQDELQTNEREQNKEEAEEKIIMAPKESKKEELLIEKVPSKILTKHSTINELPIEKERSQEKIEKGKSIMSTDTTLSQETIENTVNKIDSEPCCTKQPTEKIVRNQSDIFSLKDISTNLQTSIFSVNGSPSRRVFRKQEPAGHVFQKNEEPPSDKKTPPDTPRYTRDNYNDEKRPSSSYRNPLTGSGLHSNDEYKGKNLKRKDGNPLLGLGYDPEINPGVSNRVPPGGYSHKLW